MVCPIVQSSVDSVLVVVMERACFPRGWGRGVLAEAELQLNPPRCDIQNERRGTGRGEGEEEEKKETEKAEMHR